MIMTAKEIMDKLMMMMIMMECIMIMTTKKIVARLMMMVIMM